jgi:hypothetical protein
MDTIVLSERNHTEAPPHVTVDLDSVEKSTVPLHGQGGRTQIQSSEGRDGGGTFATTGTDDPSVLLSHEAPSSTDETELHTTGANLQLQLKQLQYRFDNVVEECLLQNTRHVAFHMESMVELVCKRAAIELQNSTHSSTGYRKKAEQQRIITTRAVNATAELVRLHTDSMRVVREDINTLSEQLETIEFKFLIACCVSHHHLQNVTTSSGDTASNASHMHRLQLNLNPLYLGQLQRVLLQQRKSWQHLDSTQRYIWVMRKIVQREIGDSSKVSSVGRTAVRRNRDGCMIT